MQAWEDFLTQQEKEVGKDTVNNWLRTLKVANYDACNLYLEAKDSFQILWFEEHIRKKVDTRLLNNNNKKIKVHINLVDGKGPQNKKGKGKFENKPTFELTFDELDPFCTFDNCVVSESNLLAYKLLCKITNYDSVSGKVIASDDHLASFNPIYLHGAEGTGKTHLLMATAHALKSAELKVIYTRAETFTQHVVSAIRAGEMCTFRQAYRNIDVLLIDNAQVFSRKSATQEELFHTFNTLHLAGKQIILAANCSPAELQYIEPRLVSRFEWGIVLPLEPLRTDEIQQVLEKKAEAFDFTLHPRVTEFLLKTFSGSTKSISRALEALILRSHLNKKTQTITLNVAKHLLADLIEEEQHEALNPEKVLQTVTEYFGIRPEDVLSKAQSRDCVLPRQIAMYICRNKLKIPFTKIGDYFSRDHSTVMTSVKQIQKGVDTNCKEIVTPYTAITKKLKR